VTTIDEIACCLEALAPTALAEDWDNVGLLLGDRDARVDRAMTCLTLTPDVAAEAVATGAGLIVSHHPILFRPIQRLTADTPEGRLLLDLAAAGIAVYSPHTGYDSASGGINQQLAELLQLADVVPLRPLPADEADRSPPAGAGRFGRLPQPLSLAAFIQQVKQRLSLKHVQYVGNADAIIERVGIACGSAAEFLRDAHRLGCECFVTGEARFHSGLEAAGLGINLVLIGHYASERPAVERLAEMLAGRFPQLTVWPSEAEADPLKWA
jgi:dinuclear metal center YbgI/SA1388 family protein